MGGDTYCSSPHSSDFQHGSNNTYDSSYEFADVGCETWIDEAAKRQRLKVYTEVLRSYEDFHSRGDSLEEAKNKILSYIPGSWDDKADSRECDVPNATSLLLIGPKSSGKSSLVNKISRAFEDNVSLPPRAQVSCSSSPGDGTYFFHEYTIPRNSGSFCLYDTRGLSLDSSENVKMIKHWMTKGVCHGKRIRRKSDSVSLKSQLKRRARRRSSVKGQVKPADFVIFVVNGLSVLKVMTSADETKKGYSQMIAMNFNNPLLSFKDDKPAIVVTHGDLLSLFDRVKVRIYLGELLGVPPTRQIFDIPESNDPATTSAIFDMLIYCLDRADRNLPTKDLFVDKVQAVANLLFWIVAAVVIIVGLGIPSFHRSHPFKAPVLHRSQPQAPTNPTLNTPVFHHSTPQESSPPPSETLVLHHSEPQESTPPPPETPILRHSEPQVPPNPSLNTPVFHHSKPQEPAPPPSETPILHCSEPQAPPNPSVFHHSKPQPPAPSSETPVLHHSEPQAPAAPSLKKPRAPATPTSKKPRGKAVAPSKKPEAPAAATQPEVEWHKIRHMWLELGRSHSHNRKCNGIKFDICGWKNRVGRFDFEATLWVYCNINKFLCSDLIVYYVKHKIFYLQLITGHHFISFITQRS